MPEELNYRDGSKSKCCVTCEQSSYAFKSGWERGPLHLICGVAHERVNKKKVCDSYEPEDIYL